MKRAFPVLWFGFLAFFLITSISSGAVKEDLMFLVVPIVMAVFGLFLMKKMVWDLMDEVADYGDYLVVKFRGQEGTIYLSKVMNVSSTTNQNPPRITLRLRSPSKFGEEISFSPLSPFSLNPFRKNEIAEDLIIRIDRARSKSGG